MTFKTQFESEDVRFAPKGSDPHLRRLMMELDFHNPDSGQKASFATAAASSPHTVSSMRSALPNRVEGGGAHRDRHLVAALEVMDFHTPDVGPKASVATGVLRSKRTVFSMRSRVPRMGGWGDDIIRTKPAPIKGVRGGGGQLWGAAAAAGEGKMGQSQSSPVLRRRGGGFGDG